MTAAATRRPSGLPFVWGATDVEHARAYDADDLAGPAPLLMTRAIDVAAPVERTWRWLCQLAVAPYSYDLVDNLGRRSPRTLTPGAGDLVLGQRMASVFVLTSFDVPHQWTGATTPRGQRLFGAVAMSYAAEPRSDAAGSRIVVRIAAAAPTRATRARATALAWGDLPMIRKQLHVLSGLAGG